MPELSSKKSSSTFSSLFEDKKKPGLKNCLIGIDKKIADFTESTNKALIVLGEKTIITNGGYIQTSNIVTYQKSKKEFRAYFKAAYNLGLILAKENYREIFLRIGDST